MKVDAASLMQLRASILQQNSALQRASAGGNAVDGLSGIAGVGGAAGGANRVGTADFGAAMKDAIGQVNAMQAESTAASESYDKGETTDIAAVMLAREKASVGFQATLQVRNKLLSAYKDIMSMPV